MSSQAVGHNQVSTWPAKEEILPTLPAAASRVAALFPTVEPVTTPETQFSVSQTNPGRLDAAQVEELILSLGLGQAGEHLRIQKSEEQKNLTQKLKEAYPAIPKLLPLVSRKNNQRLSEPKWEVFAQHDQTIAPRLFAESLRAISPQDKIAFYATIVQLLALEIDVIEYIKDLNFAISRQIAFDACLSEVMPSRYLGALVIRHCQSSDLDLDLSSTESFAFYLRYTKKLQENQYTSLFKPEDEEIVKSCVKENKPGLMAVVRYTQQMSREREEMHDNFKKFSQKLANTQTILDYQDGFPLCHRMAPALALLAALEIEENEQRCKQTGDADPKSDVSSTHYLPLRIDFLQKLSVTYLKKQKEIYKNAYNELQNRLKQDQTSTNEFFRYKYAPKAAAKLLLHTPEEFAKLVDALDQSLAPHPRPTLEQSEQNAAELLREEEQAHVKSSGKHGKKKKPVVNQVVSKKELPKQTPAKAETPKVPHLTSLVTRTLQKPLPFVLHERVKRWLQASPDRLNEIKEFQDYRDGKLVRLYENKDEEQLKTELILHGFSPLVDKILSEPELKDKYSVPTPKGFALFVELIQPGKLIQRGILVYGMDKQLCYHRKIDPKTDAEIKSQTFEQLLAKLETITPESSLGARQALSEELSSGFAGDDAEVTPMQIIQFTDRKNRCQINLFPLK